MPFKSSFVSLIFSITLNKIIMKIFHFKTFVFLIFLSAQVSAQSAVSGTASENHAGSAGGGNVNSGILFIDVHHLGKGKVTYDAVSKAHAKDLAVEKKYNVHFINFWVDEAGGNVYCLSSSPDSASIRKTHAEAHGLLPDEYYIVSDGKKSAPNGEKNYYLDVHELGAGNVTAEAVAGAHQKDLAVEKKYDVNFINYWVDTKQGLVFCLSQAPDSTNVIKTHREAHGLIPAYVMEVKPGN